MNVLPYLGKTPRIGRDVYLAPGVQLIGDVTLGDESSVWFHTVLRGDLTRISVGHHTNIQDLSLCHVADDLPCLIGNYVTVGHRAILHACTIEDQVLVGMGAIVMDGAVVGAQSIIGAGAFVKKGMQIPPGSMVYGTPAKIIRTVTPEERAFLRDSAEKYCRTAKNYLAVG